MANHKLDENYDGKTFLRKWWPIVKANFTNLLLWFTGHIDGTADRHGAKDIDYGGGTVETGLNGVKEDLTSHTSDTNNPHSVTKSQVGLGNVPNVTTNNQTPTYTESMALTNITSGEYLSTAFGKIKKAIAELINHIGNKTNPHSVTKAQVGLGNVDNTSDLNKPISAAMQTALDKKADKQTADGGFRAGDGALARHGAAIGCEAHTTDGGAVGYEAEASTGGAIGCDAYASSGGAVGRSAYAGKGFSGGYSAKVLEVSYDEYIDAIQLGTGTNENEKTLQVYDYTLMDADGTIPSERLKNAHTSITGGASTIASSNLTANRALISNSSGKVAVSDITNTELGYLDGVTGNIQTQLNTINTKLPSTANIKKNPSATSGDLISTHLSIGERAGSSLYGVCSTAIGSGNSVEGFASFANGNSNSIKCGSSFASGGSNKLTCDYSYAMGEGNTVSGVCSFAVGKSNTASGKRSVVLGGYNNTASGERSAVLGSYHSLATGENSAVLSGDNNTASGSYSIVLGGYYNAALTHQIKTGHFSKDGTAGSYTGTTGDAFIIGNGADVNNRSNAFRVAYSGNCYAAASMNSTGADYAECFEWVDKNPDNEDRVGYMTAFEGDKIRLASENDPIEIQGVVSALPAVVGDNYADEWHGKYLKDKYGRLLTEHKVYEAEYRDVEVDEEAQLTADEISVIQEEITNDETLTDDEKAVKLSEIPTTKTVKVTKRVLEREAYEADEYILNPNYNADEEYIPRLKRKEYSAVGTHGKLAVRDDGSCVVGGFCKSGGGGIATASESGFYVMERIDEETVRIYIK